MGYELYGHQSQSPVGEYISIDLRGWTSIWALMAVVNSDYDGRLIDSEALDSMATNDGAGLNNEQASTLADAIDAALGFS